MTGKKIFYPVKDVTLRGILENANIILSGLTDALAYREYVTFRDGFVLIAQEMIASAIKEIELSGGVTLSSDTMIACGCKEAKDLDATMILSAILSAVLAKTVILYGDLSLQVGIDSSALNELSDLAASLLFDGAIQSSAKQTLLESISNRMNLESHEIQTIQTKISKMRGIALDVIADINTAISSPLLLSPSGIALSGSMAVVIRRLRTLGDLTGLTLGDIQDWNLKTYYYMEV